MCLHNAFIRNLKNQQYIPINVVFAFKQVQCVLKVMFYYLVNYKQYHVRSL